MNYIEVKPPKILSGYVKCFWILESDGIPDGHSKEKILPDGCMELIFNFGDYYKEHRQGHSEIQPRSFVYGQITKFIEVSPTGKTGIIAVRFYPNGAEVFLQVPVNELTNKAVSTYDILGKDSGELEEKIVTAKNNRSRIEILQNYLICRLKKYYTYDYIIAECLKRIEKSGGTITVESLSEKYNISTRHLERKFISIVGMSPKLFSRIIRFQTIFKLLKTKQINSLTALALESGYYDQAHFIRDFKNFTGINPKTYFNQEHQLSSYFTAEI
jgi:AraC-like DNA-binding protein